MAESTPMASRTSPDLVAAQFLLKPGRKYEQAAKAFEPYDSIKEENPEARAAGKAFIAEGEGGGAEVRDVHLRQQPARRERDFHYRCDDRACLKPEVCHIIPQRILRRARWSGRRSANDWLQSLLRLTR
jgi:hypothetical protein